MNCLYDFNESDSYSFSANTTAFVEMEDGVNQWGLAIALTSVFPETIKPGMNVGMILRLLLEKCRSVKEALKLLETLPRCTSGTLVLADPSGEACLVEYTNDTLSYRFLKNNGYLCATNSFHLPEMLSRKLLVEDDWFAEERYETLENYLSENFQSLGLLEAKQLLGGKYGFVCQYDRKTGKDTVWSSIYDLKIIKCTAAKEILHEKSLKRIHVLSLTLNNLRGVKVFLEAFASFLSNEKIF